MDTPLASLLQCIRDMDVGLGFALRSSCWSCNGSVTATDEYALEEELADWIRKRIHL